MKSTKAVRVVEPAVLDEPVQLGDVVEYAIGGIWGEDPESEAAKALMKVACIRGSDYREWKDHRAEKAVTRAVEPRGLASRKLQVGDILLEVSGGGPDQPVGRTLIVDERAIESSGGRPLVPTNFLRLLRFNRSVHPDYINFFLRSIYSSGRILSYQTYNSNLRNLRFKEYMRIEVPLPPLTEQRRIAGLLTAQLAAVEKARKAAAERVEAAGKMMSALLREAFADGDEEGVELGSVCEIQLGKMLSAKSRTGQGTAKYLRNANVQWGRFDLSRIDEMDFNEAERKKFELRPGDVLVCEGGDVGRSAVWEGQVANCYYQKALHRLRPFSKELLPRFIMYRMWYGSLTNEFTGNSPKTTIAHLPAIRLAKVKLPRVSPKEQRTRAAHLDKGLEQANGLVELAKSEHAAIEALPGKLLGAVFGGG